MKRVFIGHRGVGKTELLKRHQSYFHDLPHFDLDQEIEKSQNKKISEIFKNQSEQKFRDIELNVFTNLIQNENFVISLGAGFNPENIPSDIEVVYVSRRTDSDGRIFLNRPRLNSDLTALKEYHERFHKRDPLFRFRSGFIYHLPEGLKNSNLIEENIFKSVCKIKNVFMTAANEKFNNFENIELRTDIFSDAQIKKIIAQNKNTFLISYRKKTDQHLFKIGMIDWALELGTVPSELSHNSELIISNHDDDVKTAIEKFKLYPQFHQKLCPIIHNWSELKIGHDWQSEAPDQRSFLPRTATSNYKSKWHWYRQQQFSKQKINFIQGHQDFDDQPSLFEYLSHKNKNQFVAVLGDPVHHSKTPITQSENFDLNVLAIPIQESEFETAMPILLDMGLIAAAATSPLKNLAGKLCGKSHAVNSMVLKNNSWVGTSTDEFGLQKLIEQVSNYKSKTFVVWGGGGILDSIVKILPEAIFYSAQTQNTRDENKIIQNPDVVIWAAPRKTEIQMPHNHWQPEVVLDLNYTENSMGLEYAQNKNIKYISGDVMFYAQAEKQMQFWKEHLKD